MTHYNNCLPESNESDSELEIACSDPYLKFYYKFQHFVTENGANCMILVATIQYQFYLGTECFDEFVTLKKPLPKVEIGLQDYFEQHIRPALQECLSPYPSSTIEYVSFLRGVKAL